MFYWAPDSRSLLYMNDPTGHEDEHLVGVDVATGQVRDYTPGDKVRAELLPPSLRHPEAVLVAMNRRDARAFDVYRLDLKSGKLALDTQNPGDVTGWIPDADLVVRGALRALPDGGGEIRVRSGATWQTLVKGGPDEDLDVVDFSGDGQSILLKSSIGSDTTRVIERRLGDGSERVLAQSKEVDVDKVLVQPQRRVVQAVSFAPARRQWTVLDPAVKEDFATLARLTPGDFDVVDRDAADRLWIVRCDGDRVPVRFYLYDRSTRTAELLFSTRPALESLPLAVTRPASIPARDGLALPAYLTLPVGVSKKLPMVTLVHGGPWARDTFGFNPWVQFLANRGYAVLQVNFRGSAGYGKKFLHAGDKQWGKKMLDDVVDGVKWAVAQGVADPKRVCIFGASYGGYAALTGAAFTQGVFRCAVDLVGPSNLETFVKSVPPYWAPLRAMLDRQVGNADTADGRASLQKASPLHAADQIRIPLLIAHGANDARIRAAESEQMVNAIEKQGGAVTYLLYPDEGHILTRHENWLDFFARAEKFLGAAIGGRVETAAPPPGSSVVVREIGSR
jgi:dipeptidyl aminopeptidase/acylaminoacyl peptidase